MKKKALLVILAAVAFSLCIVLAACTAGQVFAKENSTAHESTEEKLSEPATPSPTEETQKDTVPERTSTDAWRELNAKGETSGIPIYPEAKLFFDVNNDGFYLGRDVALYYYSNARVNSTKGIMRRFPTDAIRVKDNGDMYSIHETDSGYRLYLFYDQSLDYEATIGFPVVIKELLQYSDFAGLKAGDGIEAVEAIDPVAGLHKKLFTEIWQINPKGAKGQADRGYPCTSIHYLSDGLLKIEYDMPEDGVIVISRIEFAPDYILTDPIGRKVDYKIEEKDLPEQ